MSVDMNTVVQKLILVAATVILVCRAQFDLDISSMIESFQNGDLNTMRQRLRLFQRYDDFVVNRAAAVNDKGELETRLSDIRKMLDAIVKRKSQFLGDSATAEQRAGFADVEKFNRDDLVTFQNKVKSADDSQFESLKNEWKEKLKSMASKLQWIDVYGSAEENAAPGIMGTGCLEMVTVLCICAVLFDPHRH